MTKKSNRPKWHPKWPISSGLWMVELLNGEFIALKVERLYSDEYERWALCALSDGVGIVYLKHDTTPLKDYWGNAIRSFGPIKQIRERN